jgi:hypothetical protein
MEMTKARVWIVAVLLGVALALAAAPAGVSKNGDDIRVAGTCTRASTSKLKLSEEEGRIEVEFEVDQNRSGVRWTVVLVHNGKRVARLTRASKAPSGSFEARMLRANTRGADRFTARATSPSGEVCTARATFT